MKGALRRAMADPVACSSDEQFVGGVRGRGELDPLREQFVVRATKDARALLVGQPIQTRLLRRALWSRRSGILAAGFEDTTERAPAVEEELGRIRAALRRNQLVEGSLREARFRKRWHVDVEHVAQQVRCERRFPPNQFDEAFEQKGCIESTLSVQDCEAPSSHPVGASGIYQIVELFLQVTGRAGTNQVENAQLGMAQSIGGCGATAFTTILEAVS